MADDKNQDPSQKTQEATPHRLEKARGKGQIPYSREVGHLVTILFLGIFVLLMSVYTLGEMTKTLRPFLEFSSEILVNPATLKQVLGDMLVDVGIAFLWPLIILALLLIAANGAQTGFVTSLEKVKPKMSNMSPLSGLKRLFSMKSLVEFIKSIVKLLIILVIMSSVLLPRFYEVDDYQLLSLQQLLVLLRKHLSSFFFIMLFISFVLAAADYFYQRFQHLKEMRMSHQEIKDEQKEIDGDPQIKAKLREIRRKRSQANLSKAVPEASVIVTNPTHFSIALKYDQETMNAPIVVAKGVDFVALKIREIARQSQVPLVENVHLARSLYQMVEVDEEIPEQFYKSVARIIRYVMDLKENKIANNQDESDIA